MMQTRPIRRQVHLQHLLKINQSKQKIKTHSFETTETYIFYSFRSLLNSKFRPVPMQVVSETTHAFHNNLTAPVVVGGDEDVNDYYEGFKHIKKLSNLRRNEPDDDFLPFPDQSGKILQSIGSNLPKFEFKPITSLTHTQQAHLIARRAANRQHQQGQSKDVRQELEDLLNIEDFVLPGGERPLSSAELPSGEQRRYGLPPRLHPRLPPGPPKKGSLGDLLKKKRKPSIERSPSPVIDESQMSRRRRHSRSLSSTGSGQWSRSSSFSEKDDRLSRETSPVMGNKNNGIASKTDMMEEDITDMNDLSKLLDLNEEDELLLLQIEVEQEERNIRREEKRRRKEEKKIKKPTKKIKSLKDDVKIVRQCLKDLLDRIGRQEENKSQIKRTFDQTDSLNQSDELSKKIKIDETS